MLLIMKVKCPMFVTECFHNKCLNCQPCVQFIFSPGCELDMILSVMTILSFWLLHLKTTIILAIASQNYFHFGYYISNSPLSAISFQIYQFWLFHLKIYSSFIASNSTSIPTASSDTIAVSLKLYSH